MARGFELLAKANVKGKHLCVGLDPNTKHIKKLHTSPVPKQAQVTARKQYAVDIVNATAAVAACFKPNFWFWYDCLNELEEVSSHIKSQYPEVPIILDIKGGDIGNTMERAVACAHFVHADAVTVNPYMGVDDVTSEFRKQGIDCFVLARTSNPDAGRLQQLVLDPTEYPDTNLAEFVAVDSTLGGHGLVVGATDLKDLAKLSAMMEAPFLIPGVGAQGGDLAAVVAAMREHKAPWVVNVGRGIAEASSDITTWREAVRTAAIKFHDEMVPMVKGTD